jgi:UDP-N-acetylglucosamine acyltransferase
MGINNFIHPTAIIGENVVLGDNNYIGPYCVIGEPAEYKKHWNNEKGKVIIGDNNIITGHVTIDAGTELPTLIGNNCFIMKHSHIGHDSTVISTVTISCGAKLGGSTLIGYGTNIGLNAVIHQGVNVPQGCMIGMGAVITKKLMLQPDSVYVGNPARYLKPNKKP